jgi:hypothetical protein
MGVEVVCEPPEDRSLSDRAGMGGCCYRIFLEDHTGLHQARQKPEDIRFIESLSCEYLLCSTCKW